MWGVFSLRYVCHSLVTSRIPVLNFQSKKNTIIAVYRWIFVIIGLTWFIGGSVVCAFLRMSLPLSVLSSSCMGLITFSQYVISYSFTFVTHIITHVQRTKNKEFWSVRCDSLGVRQILLMIWRERRMNVIHLLCASTSATSLNVFPTSDVNARRRSDQRQANARHK